MPANDFPLPKAHDEITVADSPHITGNVASLIGLRGLIHAQGVYTMHVVTAYPDGIFCWLDLATTDADAAKAFYGKHAARNAGAGHSRVLDLVHQDR